MKKDSVRFSSIFLSWQLLLALFVLLLNDNYLKYAYPSWVTGKLSDLSGIFLVSLILFRAFPKITNMLYVVISLLFVYWKSSYSQPLIDYINSLTTIYFGRVVDYTDILALIVLPLAAKISRIEYKPVVFLSLNRSFRVLVTVAIVFAITGTSAIPPQESYLVKKTENDDKIELSKAIEIIKKVAERNGLECESCDLDKNQGLFIKSRVRLEYTVSSEFDAINLKITDTTGPYFLWPFTSYFRFDIDKVQNELRNEFDKKFKNIEFIVTKYGVN